MTVALGLVATSGAALLAVGPRLLGEEIFGGLALQWTVSTLFGLGVAAPTEQLINRELNVNSRSSVTTSVRRLGFASLLCCLLVCVAFGWSSAQGRFPWLLPGSCLAVLGWTFCAVARGRLLGAGDLRAYGQSQAVEAVGRVLLLVFAWVGGSAAWVPALLSAAVGAPLFAGAVWALLHQDAEPRGKIRSQGESQHAAFMLYALGYQACVNGLPLVLEWRAGGRLPALTGAFVVANSYFRAALIIAGGLLVQALTTLSVTWGMGDRLAFSAALRRATFRSVCLALGSSAVALVAAPYVLPLLYGGPLGLPVQASVALASSTVLVVVAAVQTTGLLAIGQGWRAVAAWSSGAVAMLAAALILPIDDGIFLWAPVAAPAAALALASWSLRAGHRAAHSATDVR